MRLGIFLALVASAAAGLNCNVGSLLIEDGVVTVKSLEQRPCNGLCSRTAVDTLRSTVVVMGCNENEVSQLVEKNTNPLGCSSTELGTQCHCEENLCNAFEAREDIAPINPKFSDDAAGTGPLCYVGYYARNNTGPNGINAGDTVNCGVNMACASINASAYGYEVEAYFCTPTTLCQSLIGTSADGCNVVTGEAGTVSGCCCTQNDCTFLPTKNPNIVVPTGVTTDKGNVTCYNGASINYNIVNGGTYQPCAGSCSSFSLRTRLNGASYLLDLFTCDPVELCNAVNLANGCSNLVFSGYNSVIRGCCCNSDKCIDPSTQPPTYPIKTLTCYSGVYVPSTNYSIGAEMTCNGQCGRIEARINGSIVKYMMCTPYATCEGLGIAQADQCYNPPLEEETKICCCSSFNNCNIDALDIGAIQPNQSYIPTNNYPIFCYGGIHLNGVPMTTGTYNLCPGECAMASFQTKVFNVTHNTTIYTCDPVTMCKSAGIQNSCADLNGTTGITACCCDNDFCFDPNRQPYGKLTCYTGVYVAEDKLLYGGEMLCDGWCASLSTTVNNKNATTYWCAPVYTCRNYAMGMGGDNNCNSISGTGNTVTGCCCSESNNCNVPSFLLPNVTAIPPRAEPPIVCFEGLYIGGAASGYAGYRICDGECVSITMGTTVNGSPLNATLYTCDSSSACGSLGLRNNCSTIDNTVTGCCCDSDACIDPTAGRNPDKTLTCYVGVQTQWNNISVGADVQCMGKCANISSIVNNLAFTSYHCMTKDVCRALALDNSCNQIQLDRGITGCCCDNGNNCNASPDITKNLNISQPEAPIACFNGLEVNGQYVGGSSWQACQGDCMSVTINSTYQGAAYLATVFSCDPTSVCTALNITNRCHQLEPSVRGCCCSDSGCIDPTKNPPKYPRGRPLSCWVGMIASYNNLNVGSATECYGSCASLSSTVGNQSVTAFACVPKSVCSGLGLYDDCTTVQADRSITGCCCDNSDNCNGKGFPVPTNHTARRPSDYPIVCYNGLFVNNNPIAGGSWQACNGDCASVVINTTINGTSYSADFYTCDPSSVCQQLQLTNNCSTVEPGVMGCCCNTDTCLDPSGYPRYPPKRPGNPLKCFVGLQTVISTVGNEVYCNGKCAQVHGLVGNPMTNVTAYMCAPTSVCRSLELDVPRQLPGDRFLTAFCCDFKDNCNVFDPTVNVTGPVSPLKEYPITCYQGIQVNGQWISNGGFQSCSGDCVMLTLNSTLNNGSSIAASIYSCDPTATCQAMGLVNNCNTIENGLQACCCSNNGCIDPSKNPPKLPGKQLMCYVGIRSTSFNLTGAAMPCNGKCSSLSGNVAGQQVSTYQCVDYSVCRSLELDDACRSIPGDREITGCCCDNYDYCNTQIDPTIVIPDPSPVVEFPITCWSGLYLNGVNLTAARYQVCNGDCVSVNINTTVGTVQHSATLYTCDPSSVCGQLGLSNTCGPVIPGVAACCCNTDACINPNTGKTPGPLNCYVGVKVDNVNAGAAVPCNGKCSSLSGKLANGSSIQTFHCVDTSICRQLELDNACNGLPGDREVMGCCCDSADYCNVKNIVGITIPPLQNYTEPPIACYTGIQLNGNFLTPPKYVGCQGQCASVSINTTVGTTNHQATVYTCDPSTVCQQLNVNNICQDIEPGLRGCCCDSDVCIDPTKNRFPGVPLTCYVGVYAAYNNYSVGADVQCAGKCASLQTSYNGNMVKSYHCVNNNVCEALHLDNSCNTVGSDIAVKGCCCDNGNNCNSAGDPVAQNPPLVNFTGTPISCWSGVYLNGVAVGGEPNWAGCKGDCAVVQFNTTVNQAANSLTLYTCDPVTVCKQLNLNNNCASLDSLPQLTGCCCDSNNCVDGTSIYPKTTGSSTSVNSLVAMLLVAVYMLVRQ